MLLLLLLLLFILLLYKTYNSTVVTCPPEKNLEHLTTALNLTSLQVNCAMQSFPHATASFEGIRVTADPFDYELYKHESYGSRKEPTPLCNGTIFYYFSLNFTCFCLNI